MLWWWWRKFSGGAGRCARTGDGEGSVSIPRLSAAITTPPLNFRATTEVPVTIGDCVWVFGCEAATKEWS